MARKDPQGYFTQGNLRGSSQRSSQGSSREGFQGSTQESFTVEEVLYEAPPLSMAPSVYQDATHGLWAVRMPASQPKIFSYGDVRACEVVEGGGEPAASKDDSTAGKGEPAAGEGAPAAGGVKPAGKPRSVRNLAHFLANPMRASVDADGDAICRSMVVVVAVRGAQSPLQLPFVMTPTKRDSDIYHKVRLEAESLRDTFLDMMTRNGKKQ